MKGRLIVVEGACDGIGKTTQYNLLRKNLEGQNLEVVTHHFPSYNTDQGKPVEMYLKGDFKNQQTTPYFIQSLYAMDRAITWYQELKEEYDNGKIILLDRYTPSSLIYQTCLIENLEERKRTIEYMEDYEYNKLGIARPDNILFLTAPFDLVTELRNARKENEGIEKDIHEQDLEFMKKVYLNSIFVANYLNWDRINCSNENGMKPIEEIQEELLQKIKIKK